MLEFNEAVHPFHVSGTDGHASSICVDDPCHEPQQCKVLVISTDPRCLSSLDTALRRMSRIEARITAAGTLSAAYFALACEEFDVAVIAGGDDRAIDLINVAGDSQRVLAVATNPSEKSAFHRTGVPTILKRDVTPASLQSLISLWQHPIAVRQTDN